MNWYKVLGDVREIAAAGPPAAATPPAPAPEPVTIRAEEAGDFVPR